MIKYFLWYVDFNDEVLANGLKDPFMREVIEYLQGHEFCLYPDRDYLYKVADAIRERLKEISITCQKRNRFQVLESFPADKSKSKVIRVVDFDQPTVSYCTMMFVPVRKEWRYEESIITKTIKKRKIYERRKQATTSERK